MVDNDAAPTEAYEVARQNGALYRLCTRRGLSAARNFGVRLAASEIVAFIDDDAVADPNWLLHSAPLFATDAVVAVTGKVVFHQSDLTLSPVLHEFDPDEAIIDRRIPDWFGMSNFGGLGLGSNFLVRRSVFNQIGGFDERLGRGTILRCSEENEFLFRILDAGFKVATTSRAIVRHPAPKPATADDARRSIAASTVMATLLAIEHPRHLGSLFRYIWGAVLRKPQPWRQRPAHLFEDMGSRKMVYAALASGPFIYLAATTRQFLRGTPVFAGGLGVLSASKLDNSETRQAS